MVVLHTKILCDSILEAFLNVFQWADQPSAKDSADSLYVARAVFHVNPHYCYLPCVDYFLQKPFNRKVARAFQADKVAVDVKHCIACGGARIDTENAYFPHLPIKQQQSIKIFLQAGLHAHLDFYRCSRASCYFEDACKESQEC